MEPNRPEPYAAAIIAYSWRQSYYRPEIDLQNNAPRAEARYLDPQIGNSVLELCRQGSHFAPNNAFFQIMAADVLFGMRRDPEALAHVKAAAAEKEYYHDYMREVAIITQHYLETMGLPQFDARVGTLNITLFPHFTDMRNTARMVVWHARQLDAHGHSGQAKELVADLIQIGSLIRSDSNMITPLLGIEVQSIAGKIERIDSPRALDRGFAEIEKQRERVRIEIVASLKKRGWPDVAAQWEQEMLSAVGYRQQLDSRNHSALVYGSVIVLMTHVASVALMMMPVFFLTALLIRLGLKSRQALEPMPEMRRSGKIGLAILTLVPWTLATVVAAIQRLGGNGNPSLPDYFFLGGTHSSVEWVVTLDLLALCSWLVFVLIRSMPDVRNPWRLPKVVLLTLLMVGLLLLSVAFVFMVGGDESMPIYAKLGLCLFGMVVILAAGRAAILRRSGKCRSLLVGLLDTLRQSSLVLGKTLLVTYLVALLVQLPFRAEVIGILRSL